MGTSKIICRFDKCTSAIETLFVLCFFWVWIFEEEDQIHFLILTHLFKTFPIGDIVDKDNPLGPTVISCGDVPEPEGKALKAHCPILVQNFIIPSNMLINMCRHHHLSWPAVSQMANLTE